MVLWSFTNTLFRYNILGKGRETKERARREHMGKDEALNFPSPALEREKMIPLIPSHRLTAFYTEGSAHLFIKLE